MSGEKYCNIFCTKHSKCFCLQHGQLCLAFRQGQCEHVLCLSLIPNYVFSFNIQTFSKLYFVEVLIDSEKKCYYFTFFSWSDTSLLKYLVTESQVGGIYPHLLLQDALSKLSDNIIMYVQLTIKYNILVASYYIIQLPVLHCAIDISWNRNCLFRTNKHDSVLHYEALEFYLNCLNRLW